MHLQVRNILVQIEWMLLSAYIFLSVCGISLNRVIDKALFYREDEDLTSLIEEFYDTSCYMYVHMYFLKWCHRIPQWGMSDPHPHGRIELYQSPYSKICHIHWGICMQTATFTRFVQVCFSLVNAYLYLQKKHLELLQLAPTHSILF